MACGALALLTPALAQADEELVPTGSLAYTWQAQPQLGCAKENLCGVRGAVTFTVQDASYGKDGNFFPPLNIDVSATARTQGPAPEDSCLDALQFSTLALNVGRGSSSVNPYGAPSSGRCAGPMMGDLSRLHIPVREYGPRKHPSFNLTGTRTAAAGPYSIAVRSTMVLRPGSNGFSESSSAGGVGSGRRHTHPEWLEEATVRYRLAASSGAMVANFRAGSGPLCYGLGDCGATGSVSVGPLSATRFLVVEGSRVVPHRVGRAGVLADLHSGRLSAQGQVPVRVQVLGIIGGGLATSCADTRSSPLVLQVDAMRRGSTVGLDDQDGEGLRTYCAGPINSDLLSEGFALSQVIFNPRQLGAPSMTLHLSGAPRFPPGPYTGGWSGTFDLKLVRVGLQAGTVRTRVG